MFIKMRPEHYASEYYLINTDNISYAWNCLLPPKNGQDKGTIGLLVKFSSGEEVAFKDMSLDEFEKILTVNERDAIASRSL